MRVSHSLATRGVPHSWARQRAPRALAALVGLTLIAGGLAACSNDSEPQPPQPSETQAADTTPEPDATETSNDAEPTAEPTPEVPEVPRVQVTDVDVVAEKLAAPWGLARLPDGDFLVTLRDKAKLLRIDQKTGKKTALTGPGAAELTDNTATVGEGGLLGLALSPNYAADHQVFVYRTAEAGNQVLSGTVTGNQLGTLEVIIEEIPAAQIHNGGGLAFGPDGHLYIGTGDADTPEEAQNIDSLAGKILRVTADGAIPTDNPMPGLPVWSMGHRNVQGFSWDGRERMYASEFGASERDELNLILAGGNYGWPEYEGPGGQDDGFIDPLKSWPPAAASPSGVAVTGEGIYLSSLRGQRLWRVPLGQVVSGAPLAGQPLLENEYGRLRNVLTLAGGDLLVLTNNTDGRGEPEKNDDVLLRIKVEAEPEQ